MIQESNIFQSVLSIREYSKTADHPFADGLAVIDVFEVDTGREFVARGRGVADQAVLVGAAVQLHPHAHRARVPGVRKEADLRRDQRGHQVVGVLHVGIAVPVQDLK